MKTLNALRMLSVLSLSALSSAALASNPGEEVAPQPSVSAEDKDAVNGLRAPERDMVQTLAGCTSTGCDGKDPASYGCTADAQILRTAWVTYGASFLAKVEGLYSASCGAQWTRVTNWTASPATLTAAQYSSINYGTRWANNVPSGWTITSDMMSATYFLQAYGEWGTGYFAYSTGY